MGDEAIGRRLACQGGYVQGYERQVVAFATLRTLLL